MNEHERDELENRLRALFAADVNVDAASARRAREALDAALRRDGERRVTRAMVVVALGAVAAMASLTAHLVP